MTKNEFIIECAMRNLQGILQSNASNANCVSDAFNYARSLADLMQSRNEDVFSAEQHRKMSTKDACEIIKYEAHKHVLNKKFCSFDISTRLMNVVKSYCSYHHLDMNPTLLFVLNEFTWKELLSLKYAGKKCISELNKLLEDNNLLDIDTKYTNSIK